jgi:ribosomal protein S20
MSEEQNIETTEATEAPAQEEAVQLGVADLQNAAQVIDAAVSRGAFRANEAAQVGAVYNKLEAFIKSVADAQKAQENAEAPASE